MKVVNYVQIDFSKNKDITVPSMQYDSGSRWVRLKLFNNGIPVNLNGIRVCIMVAKPDGKEVFNDCVIVDAENGLVEFEITNQMVVVAGEVECQIKLMEQDKLLSSEIFTLFVNKGLTPTNIDSENELNVLVDALNRVEHLDQELSGEIMASFEASQTQRDETFKEKLLEYDERFLEIKGEKGDKGDKGDTGERGLQGPVGPQGSKGDVGEQGPVGPQGPKGDKGDQGEVGAIGPIGLQGPIGLTGPQGETGPQGPKGEKGLDGRSVELGVYGGQVKWRYAGQEENVGWTPLISLDSLRGSQGPQGEKGETGPQGPKGEKGDSGGVMPADMVDYMGNQHETLKAKNDADVDWLLGEINTAHYEGQQITATDSIEGRAKSAILKGQTLVNLFEEVERQTEVDKAYRFFKVIGNQVPTLKPNTKYTLIFDKYVEGVSTVIYKTHSASLMTDFYTFGKSFCFTTIEDVGTEFHIFIKGNTVEITEQMLKLNPKIVILEGDYTNVDIPYFEGMKSVKMPVLTTTGKNTWNTNEMNVKFDSGLKDIQYFNNSIRMTNDYQGWRGFSFKNKQSLTYLSFDVSSSKVNDTTKYIRVVSDGVQLGRYDLTNGRIKVQLPQNSEEIKIQVLSENGVDVDFEFTNIQLEKDSFTSYEPYKSNILTVNEPVELRGVGNGSYRVEDTLDLKTGELISSLGKVILDGTQRKLLTQSWGNYTKTRFELIGAKDTSRGYDDVALSSDKLKPYGYWGEADKGEYFFTVNNGIDIVHSRDTDIVQWLKDNPTLIVYPLLESTVKTVDLSDYHVYSFKDTTHYSCGSEDGSLIPSLSIDVPTNLPAVVTRQKTMIHELEVENKALIDELQRVEEKSDQADLEQLSTTWEIDYRVSELEWFVEDNISSTMTVAEKINLKLGGNTMALSRFEQAKILILAGAYNRETLEKQLTNYLKRGYLTTEEYDELIALMDAKELVSEN